MKNDNGKIQLKLAEFLNKDDFLELSYNQKVGFFGQQIAKQYLLNQGYEVLSENYYVRGGEIDLVMRKGEKVYFIEVKTRTSKEFGEPFESIGEKKIAYMRKSAYIFMNNKGWLGKAPFTLAGVSVFIDKENATIWLKYFENI